MHGEGKVDNAVACSGAFDDTLVFGGADGGIVNLEAVVGVGSAFASLVGNMRNSFISNGEI